MLPISRSILTAMVITCWTCVFYISYFLFTRISFSNTILALVMSGFICSLSVFAVIIFIVKKNLETHKSLMISILVLSLCADVGINLIIQGFQIEGLLPHFYAAINITLVGIAISGGILISGIIKKPSYLIPLTAAAGLADIWSVAFGVTSKIVQSETAMNYLLFTFPVPGSGIRPIIGVTDFVFAAMFLSLSYRFNMPLIRTRVIIAASFIISISIAVFGGFGVPVLPVMGVLFIVGQYKHIKISDPKEKKDALIGILIIAAALVMVTLIKYG